MLFIDLDGGSRMALVMESEPSKMLSIVDVPHQKSLGGFSVPDGYSHWGARILHKLKAVLLREDEGRHICAMDYGGKLLWTAEVPGAGRDPVRTICGGAGGGALWATQLLKMTALDPITGQLGQQIQAEAIHLDSRGEAFLVRGAALFRCDGLAELNPKRFAKLSGDGMTSIASGGGVLLLNSIRQACLVNTHNGRVTRVENKDIAHWQTPAFVAELQSFVTVGFVRSALRFILIDRDGQVLTGPATKEGLLVGVVTLEGRAFAVMQTGRLVELSDSTFG